MSKSLQISLKDWHVITEAKQVDFIKLKQTTLISINLHQAPRDDSTRIYTCRTSYVRKSNCCNDQFPWRTLLSKKEYGNK